MSETTGLIDALSRLQADLALLVGAEAVERYRADATRRPGPEPVAVARPRTTADLAALLAFCTARRQLVAVQGGLTGLAGGARPQAGELPISLERMRSLSEPDLLSMSVEAGAGVTLEALQARAAAAGLMFGVDIGARGTATIGGMIATNAGGIRVLRHGMFRAQVLGLEAVLSDGRVLTSMRGLQKDNSGYDLKQLMIGSEGTLGIVTRARLRLLPKPRHERNALCAVGSVDAALQLMRRLREHLGSDLSACEAIWPDVYAGVVALRGGSAPLATGHALYLLVESQSFRHEEDDLFETALGEAYEAGLCQDVVLSQSGRDFTALWEIRDGCTDYTASLGGMTGHDVSLPPDAMANFLDEAGAIVRRIDPAARICVFGHLGDGNLHYVVKSQHMPLLSPEIFACAAGLGGAVTAEHGVGSDKRAHLPLVRSPVELAVMRSIKHGLDPYGILNRGRILPEPSP
ncbi:FAD-binding oxidoreductase [Rhizobium sp. SSA_523]|uniref:FAD-binding oxidoreductase n=1 Tax=Rhizobium sp. SSA_523 TaxID=2952477 RepID=UPI00209162BD|nr:FAD-binding oxidoreductase [Rhizobium sp. SSA_523]MCO5732190.1 FAD-binding oxidoreductase [Rhizobium sp. SSA_523]WKC21395.1 FAD-binding oxidoreductase [Rhizobium sp. SSA_523]